MKSNSQAVRAAFIALSAALLMPMAAQWVR